MAVVLIHVYTVYIGRLSRGRSTESEEEKVSSESIRGGRIYFITNINTSIHTHMHKRVISYYYIHVPAVYTVAYTVERIVIEEEPRVFG